MKVATIISHRNRPKLADHLAYRMEKLTQVAQVENHVLIVDCGSDPNKRTRHPSYWYPDPEFKLGKIYGHVIGIELLGTDYDYYWLNHPDLIFNDNETLKTLLRVMNENKDIGLLSPQCNGTYSGKDERGDNLDWHPVACVDYLSLLIRGKALREVGTLDPDFRYCVGADLDYGYRMWARGWKVGYCDAVEMYHLGGTTYGAPGTNTISRKQYETRSGVVAFELLKQKYGERWGEHMNQIMPETILGNQIMYCWRGRQKVKPE